jgi:hypothetical protein
MGETTILIPEYRLLQKLAAGVKIGLLTVGV